MLCCGKPWPSSVGSFWEYLSCLVADGKGRSAVSRALYAFAFMERVGGIPPQMQMSTNPILKTALDELSLLSAGGESKPKRKAPQVPLAFIEAF